MYRIVDNDGNTIAEKEPVSTLIDIAILRGGDGCYRIESPWWGDTFQVTVSGDRGETIGYDAYGRIVSHVTWHIHDEVKA